ncbi:hypothetical protein R3P38DRAFT_2778364 [Favolaschia claudopus]|uniref:Uncharacterized protein n=1 Tax=Favolaschia claudopus TaxID=2862362 RepID=A0AAW0BKQ3_9AGAR
MTGNAKNEEEGTSQEDVECAGDPLDAAESDSTDRVVLRKNESGYMSAKAKRNKKQLEDFTKSLEESESSSSGGVAAENINHWLRSEDGVVAELSEDLVSYAFERGHPLWKSHYIKLDRRQLTTEDDDDIDDESDEAYAELSASTTTELVKGPKQISKELDMKDAERVLKSSGWTVELKDPVKVLDKVVPTKRYKGKRSVEN